MKSKFMNKKTEVDGIVFDSKKEAKRYEVLKEREKNGEIEDLELQKKFVLVPTYKNAKGETVRSVSYIADFVYYDKARNKSIVEDTKGYRTEVYKIKKKLFEYKYKDIMTIDEL